MKFVILYLVCGFVLSQIDYKIEREGLIRKSDKEWFETLELDLPLKWKALWYISCWLLFPLVICITCVAFVYNRVKGYN